MVPQDQLLLMLLGVIDGIDVGWTNSKHRMWACIVAELVFLGLHRNLLLQVKGRASTPGHKLLGQLSCTVRGRVRSPKALQQQARVRVRFQHMAPGG